MIEIQCRDFPREENAQFHATFEVRNSVGEIIPLDTIDSNMVIVGRVQQLSQGSFVSGEVALSVDVELV